MNYTAQDILGVLIAFSLFPLFLIFPGYVTGFALDLFQFKRRRPIVQAGIAALVSASISPVLFFLVYRFGSAFLAHLTAWVFAIAFFSIMTVTHGWRQWITDLRNDRSTRLSILIALGWILVATLFLVDVQFGNRLYYNIDAYDYTTRVSVINAITRTGVPPASPSYFPGSPQPLTQLYYFWYILCSMVDQIGGSIVDARTALMASVVWTGLILCSTVALFIRLRSTNQVGDKVWKNAFVGIGLLLVSGLDVFPSTIYILFPKLLVGRVIEGDIEQWNEQVTAWIGSITWTPHHTIGMLACILVWMLIASHRDQRGLRQIGVSLVAGLALASAMGLSVWLVLIFLAFWGIWFIVRLIQRESLLKVLPMILVGIFMTIAISPFLLDLFGGSTGQISGGQFPLMLNVRSFYPLEFIAIQLPSLERMMVYLLALPLNYFLELGFFLVAGIIWFQNCQQEQRKINPNAAAEIILFWVTALMVTFARSTVIVNNDFGWRGWMFGQFILLIWGVDVLELIRTREPASKILIFQTQRKTRRVHALLHVLLAIGFITTLLDALLLRAWPMIIDTGIAGFPRILTPDNHLGERTLAVREAYTFIDKNTPPDTIVQFDPRFTMDRPSGLYRTRTTAISYHALYGVPEQVYEPLISAVGSIFDNKEADWISLDNSCHQYHINLLILRDLDPVWAGLDQLEAARIPVYQNRFTAVFECGDGIHQGQPSR